MTSFSRCIRLLSSGAVLPLASITVFLTTIGMAQARDFCANINYLIDQSRSQFAEVMDQPNGDAGDHDVTLALAGASYCFVTKKSKTSFYQCAWEFPYRAKQAYDTFDEFVRGVNDCIGQHATLHADQSVNHPDFYALRRFETEQAEVNVSVKEKSALSTTFVFIRIKARNNN